MNQTLPSSLYLPFLKLLEARICCYPVNLPNNPNRWVAEPVLQWLRLPLNSMELAPEFRVHTQGYAVSAWLQLADVSLWSAAIVVWTPLSDPQVVGTVLGVTAPTSLAPPLPSWQSFWECTTTTPVQTKCCNMFGLLQSWRGRMYCPKLPQPFLWPRLAQLHGVVGCMTCLPLDEQVR